MAIEAQQRALQEQKELQEKVENNKNIEELAKAKASYEKIKEACDRLAVDTQPSGDRDEWKLVEDDAIKKAMHSKGDWVKQMRDVQDEFTKYKTIISIWSHEDLNADESYYSILKDQFEFVKGAVEESVKELEEVDAERNLFSLQKESGSKIEYPKFSGKFSECFLKFREKMERGSTDL